MNSSEAFASFVSGSHEEEEGRLPQGGSPGRKKLLSWFLGDSKLFFFGCLGPRNMWRRYETEGRHLIPQNMVMLLGHVDFVCLVVGFAAVKKLKTISKNEPQGWDLRENHGQKKFFFFLAENLLRCLNCWKQLVFEHELRESNKGTQPKGSHLLSHSWWLHSVICTIQLLKERFLLNKFMNIPSNFNRKSFFSPSAQATWSGQYRVGKDCPLDIFHWCPWAVSSVSHFAGRPKGQPRDLGSPWTLIHSFELSLGLPNVWSSYNRTTASNWASTDWSSAQRKLSWNAPAQKSGRIFGLLLPVFT